MEKRVALTGRILEVSREKDISDKFEPDLGSR
jgi:hypothetical protein